MWKATVKGILARKVRLALTAVAVLLGVSFVSGIYVLTDTLDESFRGLFRQLGSGVDLVVRHVLRPAGERAAVEPDDAGDVVHLTLGGELGLGRAEAAEGAVRRRVGGDRPADDADGVAAVGPGGVEDATRQHHRRQRHVRSAIDAKVEIADQVHIRRKRAQCLRQPGLHRRVVALDAAHGAIVDVRIREEHRVKCVEITAIDSVGVADHQVFEFDAISEPLQGGGVHFSRTMSDLPQ